MIMVICNFALVILLLKILKKINKSQTLQSFDYFFIILFAGYVLLYLITEMQPRYAFIVAWIFIPIAMSSNIDSIKKHTDVNIA